MLRIKRIVIQGFKTFARKTEFVFDPGVTAVVGPNGSGKSNVADAVRWCLGEQSFGLLRSKKTADVIFAGSDKRARMGMAQVSLTLDNSDNELAIDFAEVEISRRAYRDGENEYILNGQQVRLMDITQLLAPSGLGKRAYAVIGQGLIDQVLSLKPEERRGLFEEAAGITGHQAKRTTALRRLDATQENLGRVQDILAELSPRLGYLKRQAERARERAQVDADLQGLLHQWYGYRWHTSLEEMAAARGQSEAA
ncbi:MAG: AAA family ATPase, partial [Caldilineaceae bacterium]